jgi:hypothetical protein
LLADVACASAIAFCSRSLAKEEPRIKGGVRGREGERERESLAKRLRERRDGPHTAAQRLPFPVAPWSSRGVKIYQRNLRNERE